MRSIISIIVFLSLHLHTLSQTTLDLTKQKKEIIKGILDTLIKGKKNLTDGRNITSIVCAVDSRFREVRFNSGFAGKLITFSEPKIDSGLIKSLLELTEYPNFSVIEKSKTDIYRDLIITSSSFLQKGSCDDKCNRLYVEVGIPIEGWEVLSFYDLVWTSNFIKGKDEYLQYSLPTLTVPLFIYQETGDERKITEYLFCYTITNKNGKTDVLPSNIILLASNNKELLKGR